MAQNYESWLWENPLKIKLLTSNFEEWIFELSTKDAVSVYGGDEHAIVEKDFHWERRIHISTNFIQLTQCVGDLLWFLALLRGGPPQTNPGSTYFVLSHRCHGGSGMRSFLSNVFGLIYWHSPWSHTNAGKKWRFQSQARHELGHFNRELKKQLLITASHTCSEVGGWGVV